MDYNDFVSALRPVLERSSVLSDCDLHVDFVLNPNAGLFRRRRSLAGAIAELQAYVSGKDSPPVRREHTVELHVTTGVGHAREIGRGLADHGLSSDARRLVLIAGGDGTAVEVCTGMLERSVPLPNTVVFRLPLGTGNDGADVRTMTEACETLTAPWRVETTGVFTAEAKSLPPYRAFNIGSIGLDGYVTDLTNRFKEKFPGDMYKLMVDFATLFFESKVGLGEMRIQAWKGGVSVRAFKRKIILLAMGISGGRTYGSGKRILPGVENVCAMNSCSLARKLKIKSAVMGGTHRDLSETDLFEADKIVIEYGGRIPIQMDGEAVWLGPENFPLTFTVGPTQIQVLRSIKYDSEKDKR